MPAPPRDIPSIEVPRACRSRRALQIPKVLSANPAVDRTAPATATAASGDAAPKSPPQPRSRPPLRRPSRCRRTRCRACPRSSCAWPPRPPCGWRSSPCCRRRWPTSGRLDLPRSPSRPRAAGSSESSRNIIASGSPASSLGDGKSDPPVAAPGCLLEVEPPTVGLTLVLARTAPITDARPFSATTMAESSRHPPRASPPARRPHPPPHRGPARARARAGQRATSRRRRGHRHYPRCTAPGRSSAARGARGTRREPATRARARRRVEHDAEDLRRVLPALALEEPEPRCVDRFDGRHLRARKLHLGLELVDVHDTCRSFAPLALRLPPLDSDRLGLIEQRLVLLRHHVRGRLDRLLLPRHQVLAKVRT